MHYPNKVYRKKRKLFYNRFDNFNKNYYFAKIDKSKNTSRMTTNFGKYIRKLRVEKGLTLTQLAAQLNLDSANLSKIENGKRTFHESRLEKLSHALKVDLNTIKSEFYSDYIAQKLYNSECLDKTLILTEKKVQYLIRNNRN